MPMFPNDRRRPWPHPPEDDLSPAADISSTAELAMLRDQLRVARAENNQLHEMLAAQARTITAVQQLVGVPAPATINATIDVRLDGEAVTTPEGRKEIEAFIERLRRIDRDPSPHAG